MPLQQRVLTPAPPLEQARPEALKCKAFSCVAFSWLPDASPALSLNQNMAEDFHRKQAHQMVAYAGCGWIGTNDSDPTVEAVRTWSRSEAGIGLWPEMLIMSTSVPAAPTSSTFLGSGHGISPFSAL